jgi:hypothetical protein
LCDLIANDHMLKRVDAVLDLLWLWDAVRPLYNEQSERRRIGPEAAV